MQKECWHTLVCVVLRRLHGAWNWFVHKHQKLIGQQRHGINTVVTMAQMPRMFTAQVVESRTVHAGGISPQKNLPALTDRGGGAS